MPAEVNGNHAIAHFNRARVIMYAQDQYVACGKVVMTPYFIFVSGHHGEAGGLEPIVSMAIPREAIRLINDHSVEPCETHDQMDAEAKAQMEAVKNAEESKED